MDDTSHLGIVGAGLSGLAAAWALRDAPCTVTFLEKSRGVSGRAATRGKHGVRYDHGANYFSLERGRVRDLLETLPDDDRVRIDGSVWTFDADGTLHAPEDDSTDRWTYRSGISTLGKLLARTADATVRTTTRAARLDAHDNGAAWHVVDTDGAAHGPYDAVLLTPPAPQTADLLRASDLEPSVQSTLLGGLEAAEYIAQFTYVFAFDAPVAWPGEAYGLRNTDGGHPVAWVGRENAKPGHVLEGQTVLVLQMAPGWTRERLDTGPEAFLGSVQSHLAHLLDADVPTPRWTDTQRWRYSLPVEPADADALSAGRSAGLFVCGDAVAGKGRVGAALESGLDAAERIRTALSAAR